MTTDTAKPEDHARDQLAKWMSEFCERNYEQQPQHVFWEIERYLRNSVPNEVFEKYRKENFEGAMP